MSHEHRAATLKVERDSDFRVPHASGRPPQDFPYNFPFPSLFPDIAALLGVSSASQLAHQLLGCTPQACKPCNCSASGPEKEPADSDRDFNSLLDGRILPVRGKGSWSNTPPRTTNGSRTWQHPYCSGEKEATIYRGNRGQVGSSVTRETSGWAGSKCIGSY